MKEEPQCQGPGPKRGADDHRGEAQSRETQGQPPPSGQLTISRGLEASVRWGAPGVKELPDC